MTRVLVTATLLTCVAGCQPARQFEPGCGDGCYSPWTQRRLTPDVLEQAPLYWKFFDEYGATIPPRCGIDAGTRVGDLTPLWERTLVSSGDLFDDFFAPSGFTQGGRAQLAVHDNGTLAVSFAKTLWILDAATGTPRHIVDRIGLGESVTPRQGGGFFYRSSTVAFTPDGRLWVETLGPVLVDLHTYFPMLGYSVPVATPVSGGIGPTWVGSAPAVDSEGTLFWLGGGGMIQAKQSDGQIRWEAPNQGGVPLLASDDLLLVRHNPAHALDARTGETLWSTVSGEILLGDDAVVRGIVPIFERDSSSIATVTLRRPNDGTVVRTLRRGDDGGLRFDARVGAVSADGTLYLATSSLRGQNYLAAFDAQTGVKWWDVEAPIDGQVVPGTNGRVYFVGGNCELTALDAFGQVAAQYIMQGNGQGRFLKLHQGVLYVLTELGELSEHVGGDPDDMNDWLYPGSRLAPLVDGGRPPASAYGCQDGWYYCFIARPRQTLFAKLYAFRVE